MFNFKWKICVISTGVWFSLGIIKTHLPYKIRYITLVCHQAGAVIRPKKKQQFSRLHGWPKREFLEDKWCRWIFVFNSREQIRLYGKRDFAFNIFFSLFDSLKSRVLTAHQQQGLTSVSQYRVDAALNIFTTNDSLLKMVWFRIPLIMPLTTPKPCRLRYSFFEVLPNSQERSILKRQKQRYNLASYFHFSYFFEWPF